LTSSAAGFATLGEVFDVHPPCHCERGPAGGQQAHAICDVQKAKERDHCVISLAETIEDVSAAVLYEMGKTATLGQISCQRVEIGLQLERGDMGSTSAGYVTRRTTDARSDVEHSHAGPQTEGDDRFVDSLGAEVVVLVERRQLLDRQRRGVIDIDDGQFVVDALDLVVELHGLHWCTLPPPPVCRIGWKIHRPLCTAIGPSVVVKRPLIVGLVHRAYSSPLASPARRVDHSSKWQDGMAPDVECRTPCLPEGTIDMKVKWKHHIARLIPAATMVAAVVATIGAQASSVKWG